MTDYAGLAKKRAAIIKQMVSVIGDIRICDLSKLADLSPEIRTPLRDLFGELYDIEKEMAVLTEDDAT